MIPYWLLYAYFFAGTAVTGPSGKRSIAWSYFFGLGILITAFMVGLRYHVGTDWVTYARIFNWSSRWDIQEAFARGDPAYGLLNVAAHQLGVGLWFVNLICAVCFAWGLGRFARQQPDSWLAMLVAVPYLVIVVAMGYTRQGAAIGLVMLGLAALQRGASVVRFAAYIAAASTFHSTAVVALPLVAMATQRSKFFNIAAVVALSIILYLAFLDENVDRFVKGYLEKRYNSQGAVIRVALVVLPSLLFLAFQRRFLFTEVERQVWRNFALAGLGALAALLISPSSTAVDRVSLYLIPIQIAVLGRISIAFPNQISRFSVMIGTGLVLFVWINFATNSIAWVPYRTFLQL